MTILHLIKSIGRSSLRRGVLLIALMLASFALSPMARAQLSPPPDGGYPNNNTAVGDEALFSLAPEGMDNTANGLSSLHQNTTGSFNTATGAAALLSNTTGGGNTATGEAAFLLNTIGSQNTALGFHAG